MNWTLDERETAQLIGPLFARNRRALRMVPDQVEGTSRVGPLRQVRPGMRGIFDGDVGDGTALDGTADECERKLADEAVPCLRFDRVEPRLCAVC